MRKKFFYILINLVMFPCILYGQQYHYEHIPIDFTAIKLQSPFIQQQTVYQEWKQLAVNVYQALNLPTGEGYNETLIAKMTAFIAAYPSEHSAVSAKYYFAVYLQNEWIHFEEVAQEIIVENEDDEEEKVCDPSLLILLKEDMLRMYHEIAIEAPETWQGKLSAHVTAEYIDAMREKGQAYREKRRALWPLLLDFQQEWDLHFLPFFEGIHFPIEKSICLEHIWFAVDEGNFSEAEIGLVRMKEKYQGNEDTLRAEKYLERAYERVFEGGLHNLPDEELVQRFMSSQDQLERRQAAAALGNIAKWGSLHLTNKDALRITQNVVDYIDRAMSGNANEQTEMIDLIYRLWALAVPALLDALNSDDPARAAFAGERLLYMRNEEIITDIIDNARATTNNTKRAELIGLLTRMNEPCVSVMRFRGCLPDEQLQELYQRLVVPAIQELQASSSTTMP